MATSSELTTGDALVMSADIIKLLAPVLKRANKDQIQHLKRNSAEVQATFGRMLNGEKPVVDHSWVKDSFRIVNKTGLEFLPNLRFKVDAVAMGWYPDTFVVTIIIPDIFKDTPLWKHKLSEPIAWLGHYRDGFVSFNSVLSVKSAEQAKKLRNTVQSSLITEVFSLTFLKYEEKPDTYMVYARLEGTEWKCTDYFKGEELKPLLKDP